MLSLVSGIYTEASVIGSYRNALVAGIPLGCLLGLVTVVVRKR